MNIEAKQPTVRGPAQTFSGDVWFDVVAPEGDYPRMRVNVVRFVPGAPLGTAIRAARPFT